METPREQFEKTLSEFGKATGIGEIAFDERDICTLSFDDVFVNVYSDPDTDVVVVYAQIGYLGGRENRAAFVRRMLEENLFWEKTYGYTLMMEPESDLAVVADRRVASRYTDCDYLAGHLENCVKLVRRWREILGSDDSPADVREAYMDEEGNVLRDRLAALARNWMPV